MDEARRVLERLARISELEREEAPAADLLAELRELLCEAEAWVRVEPQSGAADEAIARLREALEAGDREEAMLLPQ
jgi:hypothetical protein